MFDHTRMLFCTASIVFSVLSCPSLQLPAELINRQPDQSDFTLCVAGDLQGQLQPHGCQLSHASTDGGPSRIANVLKTFEFDSKLPSIRLAVGQSLTEWLGVRNLQHKQDEDRIRTLLKCLDEMKFDAVGISAEDLAWGSDRLREFERNSNISFVSANVYDKASGNRLFAPTTEIVLGKDQKAIVIGLTGSVNEKLPTAGIEVRNPQQELKEVLESIIDKDAMVILLSTLPREETQTLVEKIAGIHMVVSKHSDEFSINVDMNGQQFPSLIVGPEDILISRMTGPLPPSHCEFAGSEKKDANTTICYASVVPLDSRWDKVKQPETFKVGTIVTDFFNRHSLSLTHEMKVGLPLDVAEYHWDLGQWARAADCYSAEFRFLKNRFAHPEPLFEAGYANFKSGREIQATALLRDYAKAIASQPHHLFTAGLIPHQEGCTTGRTEEIAQFLNGWNMENLRSSENWFVLGFYQWMANQPKKAEYSLSQAILKSPNHTLSLLIRGLVRQDQGTQGWEEDLVQVCHSEPEVAELIVNLSSNGWIVGGTERQTEAVISRGIIFASLLREHCKKPQTFEIDLLKKRATFRLGREAWDLTKDDLQTARRFAPDDIETIYQLWLLAKINEETKTEIELKKDLLSSVLDLEERSEQIGWLAFISAFGNDKQLALEILDEESLQNIVAGEVVAFLKLRLGQTGESRKLIMQYETTEEAIKYEGETIPFDKVVPWFPCLLALASNQAGEFERGIKMIKLADQIGGKVAEHGLTDSLHFLLLRKELSSEK